HDGRPAFLMRRSRGSRGRMPGGATVPTLVHRIAAGVWHSLRYPFFCVMFAGPGFAWVGDTPPALAQAAAIRPAAPAVVPSFWDPRRRPERPDLTRLTTIRFMTEVDYPPFNFAGPDGNPVGFNVDLARMVCEELKVTCTVQMRRFDTLFDALDQN